MDSATVRKGAPRRVRVVCSARLHMGFFDLNGASGRRFGSIGLALDAPETRLSLECHARTIVEGAEAERAGRYLAIMADHLELSSPHRLVLASAIPAHAGLGSGTQLALAVAAALRGLHGLPLDLTGDAMRLGRGGRSGVGIGVFEQGGLVIDGGRGSRDRPPPVLARLPVPADWHVLLLRDPSRAGLAGGLERDAFTALPPMPSSDADHICRLVLMRALPALAEADLPSFGAAINQLQAILGDYFAPTQGGRFNSPLVATALAHLTALGAKGAGQSSWGPTGFAFAADAADADRLARSLADHETAKHLDWTICRALNRGARVIVETGD